MSAAASGQLSGAAACAVEVRAGVGDVAGVVAAVAAVDVRAGWLAAACAAGLGVMIEGVGDGS
jgi:hypothetical protein